MMRGELIWVWSETWREIWSKLAQHREAPRDLFCEFYRELAGAIRIEYDAQTLADIVDDPIEAKTEFRRTKVSVIKDEQALISFLEGAHSVTLDIGEAPLADRYFTLVAAFLQKYSLRYSLRPPFILTPTLPGIFAKLISELRAKTKEDTHLDQLMKDFEIAIGDLRNDNSDGRIKTCMQKQMNLLEAMAQNCPGVTENSLNRICDQLSSWPHRNIKNALKNLYTFACDYPGIRHAGRPGSVLRDIDMRDLVAVSIVLAGFSPYLTEELNPELVYCGD